jgi:hypothetical protein
MTSSVKLDCEFHLQLWASQARQIEDVGYYRKQPWYIPAGYRDGFLDTSRVTPSEDDYDLADRVGRVVQQIARRAPVRGRIVRLYYGAYPGAEVASKKDRIEAIKEETGITVAPTIRSGAANGSS